MRSKVLKNQCHRDNQYKICGICFTPMKMKRVVTRIDAATVETSWKRIKNRSAYDSRTTQVAKVLQEVYGDEYPLDNINDEYHSFYPYYICRNCFNKLESTVVDETGDSIKTIPPLKYTSSNLIEMICENKLESHLYQHDEGPDDCFICKPFVEYWKSDGNFRRKWLKRQRKEVAPDTVIKFCANCRLVKKKNHRCGRTNKETTTFLNNVVDEHQVGLCFSQNVPDGQHNLRLPSHGNKGRQIQTDPSTFAEPHTVDELIKFERE